MTGWEWELALRSRCHTGHAVQRVDLGLLPSRHHDLPRPSPCIEASRRCRVFIAIATLVLLLPGPVALAQAPLETDDPSPATRHAQVIAHGVAPMPARGDCVAAHGRSSRAANPRGCRRTAGRLHPGRQGVVALIDQEGRRLARIAPGEAVWTEPGVARAVIGIERKAPDYYDIALVPATELAEGDPVVIGGAPFVAPAGDAFDVDLIRDVLNRAEESVVSTGSSPALLLVTSGTVFVESSSGLVEMTTGDAAQVAGDVVITGASRAPAAFVVARIGPEGPAPDAAEDSPADGDPGCPSPPRSPRQRARRSRSRRRSARSRMREGTTSWTAPLPRAESGSA